MFYRKILHFALSYFSVVHISGTNNNPYFVPVMFRIPGDCSNY